MFLLITIIFPEVFKSLLEDEQHFKFILLICLKILAYHPTFAYKEWFHLQSVLDSSFCKTRSIFDNIPVKNRILPGVQLLIT